MSDWVPAVYTPNGESMLRLPLAIKSISPVPVRNTLNICVCALAVCPTTVSTQTSG
ncbi:hypothetical protein D3C87_1125840 [compost metagenome]